MANNGFDKTMKNPEVKSSGTTRGGSGRSRGVEHPIAEDMALSGDTRHELHTKPIPRKGHQNNYGADQHAGPDPNMLRIDDGKGMC